LRKKDERGGAVVFFAKEQSRAEIINDANGKLVNFYEVSKTGFSALEKEIAISLHSTPTRMPSAKTWKCSTG